METTTITKKEQLAIKQAIETLTNQLNRKLVDFKERFLTSYVNFRFSEFDVRINRIKKEEFKVTKYQSANALEAFENNKVTMIENLEKQKAFKSTNTLVFIKEAEENYNTKFERLVNKLVEHEIRSYPLTIEFINSGSTSNDFNFLISHNTSEKQIQVYARIIFAEGEINAPHYRFIITANKKLIH
jgi:actin-related protein